MTEKRFTIEPTMMRECIVDNNTGEQLDTFDYTERLCELLNELSNECEFLEIENEALEDGATKYAELCHKTLKENKKLKQALKMEEEEAEVYNVDAMSYQTLYEQQVEKNEQLKEENEQLKQQNLILKGKLHRLRMEKGALEEEIECLSEETVEQFKQDLRDGKFIEYTAR